MSARELKPRFSLHYNGEPFPGEEDKNRLGYEPDAVYLKDSLNTLDVRDPTMKLFGETGEELLDSSQESYALVFRYRNKAEDQYRLSRNIGEVPSYQCEGVEASLTPNKDFEQLVNTLSNELDESDILYSKKFGLRRLKERHNEIHEYINSISRTGLDIFPSEEGVLQVNLYPRKSEALISQYSHDLKLGPEEPNYQFKNGFNDEGEEAYFDYSDQEVEELEDTLRSLGFEISNEILPPTVVPPDF